MLKSLKTDLKNVTEAFNALKMNEFMIDFDGKRFQCVANSDNGEVTDTMVFEYQQKGRVLTCLYQGENIVKGHLLGVVDDAGHIDMRYHQINKAGQILTGVCKSTPELLPNGKIRLHEKWQWTSGDQSEGFSVLEEV